MRTLIFSLFLLFMASTAIAKDVVGTVREKDGGKEILNCTVELLSVRDSSVVAQTVTKEHNFYTHYSFQLPVENDSSYILRFSMVGYQTLYMPVKVEIAKKMNKMSLGVIYLEKATKLLPEVVVKGTKIKMVMKGDTIVYNADAFALAEGSMLDALIKQLLGCRLDKGTIYVNGKRVSSLLVDGRKFFTGDPKLALENLPSYVVDKVKVYDHSGAASRLVGEDMGDKELVVDINLKKKYKTGAIEELEAGYGTHDRYMAQLSSMLFSSKNDVMVKGGLYNIADNELSGSLSDNSTPDRRSAGGMARYSFKGKTYDDSFMGDLFVSHDRDAAKSRTNTENYLQGGNIYTAAENNSLNKNFSMQARDNFSIRRKNHIISGRVLAQYSRQNQYGNSHTGQFDAEPTDYHEWLDSLVTRWNAQGTVPFGNALYRSISETRTRQTNVMTSLSLSDRMAFGKSEGRYANTIRWGLSLKYNHASGKVFNINQIDYQKNGSSDFRSNYYVKPSTSYSYTLDASYGFRLTSKADKVNSLFGYLDGSFSHSYSTSDNDLYRLDQLDYYTSQNYTLGMLPSSKDDLLQVLDASNSIHNSMWNTNGNMTLKLEST